MHTPCLPFQWLPRTRLPRSQLRPSCRNGFESTGLQHISIWTEAQTFKANWSRCFVSTIASRNQEQHALVGQWCGETLQRGNAWPAVELATWEVPLAWILEWCSALLQCHSTCIQMSPFYVTFGRHPMILMYLMLPIARNNGEAPGRHDTWMTLHQQRLQEAYKTVSRRLGQAANKARSLTGRKWIHHRKWAQGWLWCP